MAEKTKKKTKWPVIITMAAMMLTGAFCGVFMAWLVDTSGSLDRGIGQVLLLLGGLLVCFCAVFYLQIIIHEAGHLVFGLLTGYRFTSFRIGSFMWIKDGDKLRFKRFRLAGTGGQCLMSPPPMLDGEFPVILYNLGGSLMNIGASILFLGLYAVTGKSSFLGTVSLMAAVIGFAQAALNGIPLRLMVDNDGYNALSLSRDPAARKAFWLQMKINEQVSAGVRLKDMPEEWFPQPDDAALKNSMVAAIAVFGCNRLMDAHRFGEAEQRMAHLMDGETGIVDLHKNLLVCDRIYMELLGENRSERLQGWRTKELEQFMRSMRSFPSVIRTQYAYALLGEADAEKAASYQAQFEKAAAVYPYPSDMQSERELMALAEEKHAALSGKQA